MIKGYKVRIYPTKKQVDLIWKHIHACRFLWNYMLTAQATAVYDKKCYLSRFQMINLIPAMKKQGEYSWLKDVSSTSLQQICTFLSRSYGDYFKGNAGRPRKKNKRNSKQSYPVSCDPLAFYFDGNTVQIPKLGRVKYKSDFMLPNGSGYKFINVAISFICGKYILSFSMECDNQARKELTAEKMGIDLGIKETAVVAIGDRHIVYHNINKSKSIRQLKRRIKHSQRCVSRKYESIKSKTGKYVKTKNIIKEENKLRKMMYRLSCIRNNYIHQMTRDLVNMLPSRVTMETLNVRGMLKNRHLSNSISEQNFYEIVRQMKYKCEDAGIDFVRVPTFYPSSKTCSCCGSINKRLKLSDRTYICDNCGLSIDRDYNAAINLMKYADLHAQAVA